MLLIVVIIALITRSNSQTGCRQLFNCPNGGGLTGPPTNYGDLQNRLDWPAAQCNISNHEGCGWPLSGWCSSTNPVMSERAPICCCFDGWNGNACTNETRLWPMEGTIPNCLCGPGNNCSGHGTCVATAFGFTCESCDEGYFGSWCASYSCFGMHSDAIHSPIYSGLPDSEKICSGHGTCTGLDTCECVVGWTIDLDCSTPT